MLWSNASRRWHRLECIGWLAFCTFWSDCSQSCVVQAVRWMWHQTRTIFFSSNAQRTDWRGQFDLTKTVPLQTDFPPSTGIPPSWWHQPYHMHRFAISTSTFVAPDSSQTIQLAVWIVFFFFVWFSHCYCFLIFFVHLLGLKCYLILSTFTSLTFWVVLRLRALSINIIHYLMITTWMHLKQVIMEDNPSAGRKLFKSKPKLRLISFFSL